MPKQVESKLKKEADDKNLKGKHRLAFIYGTMNKLKLLGKK